MEPKEMVEYLVKEWRERKVPKKRVGLKRKLEGEEIKACHCHLVISGYCLCKS